MYEDYEDRIRARNASRSTVRAFFRWIGALFIKAVKITVLTAINFTMAAFVAFILAYPLMWLWNFTVPYVIHGTPKLDIWHSLCLLILWVYYFKGTVTAKEKTE